MFSPNTTAAIAAIVNRRRTSPRLQGAALSHGGASSQGLPSGGTTESRRGGNNTNAAPTPARRLPFSVGWETPLTGTYSVSSISQSTKSPSRRSAAAAAAQPPAKRAKRTPNATEGKGSSLYDADDGGDKYDDEDDIIPATDGPMVAADQDIAADLFIAEKSAELVEKHRQEFMKRAFSVRTHAADVPLTTASASIKMCRPQKDLDYIIYILQNWRVGVNIKLMDPCPERDSISKFRKANNNGAKYVKQYVLEEISVPGSDTPRTVLRRYENGAVGRIVVSREQVFHCIDEWHRDNGHMGQERTWGYCKEKYWNIAQALVKHYCETCPACMKKNPITQPAKGSRKPIRSRRYRDRFQIDLIDFRKLRKRDPFGVLMRWVMCIKDHATGLTYLCALPRKRPHLIAYKLQEIFGIIGFPKIFHTDNGKEFTAKVVLKALREMNPHIFTVTGRPRRPSDQGSVESMNKLVKRILGTLLTERRLAGDNPNWTEVLGMVSATINSQHGRGKDDVSSFEAVYGQVLNHDMSCSKAEARECWTLPQFLKVTNDEEFAEYAAKNYILDEDSSDADERV